MALLAEISSITQRYFMPKLVDNIFNSNALLQRFKKERYNRIDGGTDIVVPVAYATTTAGGWYSGADTLTTLANDQVTAAVFDWKEIYSNITITRKDELKNSGKSQIVNFVKAKVQLAEKTMKDTMGTALFNAGSVTNAFDGLRLVTAITGTYGGIAKGTYSWWQGQVDSTTTSLTIPTLQALYGDAQVDSDGPTVAVTTQDIYDDYYSLLQPQQRFTDSETAKGGFKNLMFNGIPIIVDSHCASGYLHLINENYLELVVHKDEDFRFEPFIKPVNQNVSTAKIYWTGQFTCSNCRMQAMFSALT